MADPHLILYSTNTWLAYAIADRYYGGFHYVWCTPYFDRSAVPSITYTVPPSSSPAEIYRGLSNDVARGDRHSSKIAANRTGILRGMEAKKAAGIIDNAIAQDILSILDAAELYDFRPIIYVSPFELVKNLAKPVPLNQRANRLSVEFLIEALPRHCFDVIGLEGI